MRRTKIVATLGPACQAPDQIAALISAGVDVARLNQSHGSRRWHAQTLERIRVASARLKKPVAVLVDLQGPKVRIGRVKNGSVTLAQGDFVTLAAGDRIGDEKTLFTPLGQLVADVRKGDRVLIDDGNIALEVVSKRAGRARCRITAGGLVSDHKGINLPGVPLSIPSVTDKDILDLDWAARARVEYVAVSFVRSAGDITLVRRRLHKLGSPIKIIAKIEKPEAVAAIDEIAAVSDGLMVARGDLGVEMPLEDVPVAQRHIIATAHAHDIPVIVATQMLQSMTDNPRPTRAEVSDVAGAIFGGTDAVMLSGETASGRYPLASVRQMAAIAEHSENFLESTGQLQPVLFSNPVYSIADAVCHGANSAARDLGAKAVFIATTSGRTALLFSKYRFPGVLVGASDDPEAVRRMALYWGVIPVRVRKCSNHHRLLAVIEKAAVDKNLVAPGDTLLFVSGSPFGKSGATNLLLVHRVPTLDRTEGAAVITGATPHGRLYIDRKRCIRCGVCVGNCPALIFKLEGEQLAINRAGLDECQGDWQCVKGCPVDAISVKRKKRKAGKK